MITMIVLVTSTSRGAITEKRDGKTHCNIGVKFIIINCYFYFDLGIMNDKVKRDYYPPHPDGTAIEYCHKIQYILFPVRFIIMFFQKLRNLKTWKIMLFWSFIFGLCFLLFNNERMNNNKNNYHQAWAIHQNFVNIIIPKTIIIYKYWNNALQYNITFKKNPVMG